MGLFVERESIFDNDLVEEKKLFTVLDSTDPDVAIGSIISSVPNGYNQVVCRCDCLN